MSIIGDKKRMGWDFEDEKGTLAVVWWLTGYTIRRTKAAKSNVYDQH